MTWRIVGGIGRTLIASGVILLLFVVYQLWGTGIYTAGAQNKLESELSSLADDFSSAATDGEDLTNSTEPPATNPPADLATTDEAQAGLGFGERLGMTEEEIAALPSPAPGEAAGQISIPSIGSDFFYVEDVALTYLRDGPGHFPGTSWPGQEGNAALAGHRTTYGAPFHRLDEIKAGDPIIITTPQGQFEYRAMTAIELAENMPFEADPTDTDRANFIVAPDASWILDDYGDNRITLMACHPKYSASQRIVVVGELIGEVAPTTPPSPEVVSELAAGSNDPFSATELLGNDPSARLPTLLWGLAAAAVWIAAWQIGRTWRRAKWPTYVLGTPVFLLVLFGAFTQVERLLPAAY